MTKNGWRIFLAVLAYAVLTAAAVAVLVPLAWALVSSFKTSGEIFTFPPALIPAHPAAENYRRLINEAHFGRYFINSIFVASASTTLSLLFCSMGGYALAKFKFPGRQPLFAVMLGSMMVPFHVLMVPLFELMFHIGWIDTYWAIVVPFSASAFGIYLMRQYVLTVPDSLIDSARIDGAGEWRIYWEIILPVVKPALGALTIFVFLGEWNNFLWPLIVLRDESKYTLTVGLASLLGSYQQQYGIVLAGSILAMVPVVLLFLFLQREFVSGLTLGAVKE